MASRDRTVRGSRRSTPNRVDISPFTLASPSSDCWRRSVCARQARELPERSLVDPAVRDTYRRVTDTARIGTTWLSELTWRQRYMPR